MFYSIIKNRIAFLLILSAFSVGIASAQTTEFTYQGRLSDNLGNALTGSYDFEFQLLEANSNPLGTQIRLGVSVSSGAFTTTLDFGSNPQQFTGAPRLLKISVRPAGSGAYTILSPNQPITSAPYSIRSREATTADAAINATQLGGVPAARFVQTDAGGNVSVGGNLSVGGTLTQAVVNATTEYQIGGQRVLNAAGSNTFVGLATGSGGVANTFVGNFAGQTNTSIQNTFVGAEAGRFNTDGNQNSFFGNSAGENNSGSLNSFFGSGTGKNNSGNQNSFFGQSAGFNNTTGVSNSFFGVAAGGNCPSVPCPNPLTGGNNSFFGNFAGFSNTTGDRNSFFGSAVGSSNTTGRQNSFFGFSAGNDNTTGISNAFFGFSAGSRNTTAGSNSFFGSGAGSFNTNGGSNTFVGNNSGFNNLTGGSNTFVGSGSGNQNTTGNDNVLIGISAGIINTTGSSNTLVGTRTDFGANNLNHASAFGAGAIVNSNNTLVLGRNLDTVQIPGNLNLAGSFTGSFIVPATNITGILGMENGGTNLSSPGGNGNFLRSNGTNWTSSPILAADIPGGAVVKKINNLTDNITLAAGANITITPTGNTLTIASTGGGGGCGEPCTANIFNANTQYNFGGERILYSFDDNLAVGLNSGTLLGTDPKAVSNTFFGSFTGASNTDGYSNSFFGNVSGIANLSGKYNSFFGAVSGNMNTTGEVNSFFGAYAGSNNTEGSENSFFGNFAGAENTTGIANSYFGRASGQLVTAGIKNTFVGWDSDLNAAGTSNNNTLLGSNTRIPVNNLSYATAIGAGASVSTSNTIALGRTSGADTVRIYGNLVVDGTTTFTAKANEVLEASVKKQDEQIQTQANQIQKQNAQIEAQAKQLEQQQLLIEGLKKILCKTNPTAEVCLKEREKYLNPQTSKQPDKMQKKEN